MVEGLVGLLLATVFDLWFDSQHHDVPIRLRQLIEGVMACVVGPGHMLCRYQLILDPGLAHQCALKNPERVSHPV
jgi:hypothetical protein